MCSVLALVLLSFRSVSEQAKYVYRTYFVVKFSRFKASVVRLLQKKNYQATSRTPIYSDYCSANHTDADQKKPGFLFHGVVFRALRVTRLGKFLPIGRLFTLGSF
jgi:hypothetical protein